MIKRTLYFGNPAYLSLKLNQLEIQLPGVPTEIKKYGQTTVPITDIGLVILDHAQITISQPCLNALLHNNVAIISCNESHMPYGLFLPLDVHHTQQERFAAQIAASLPLKKQLWQQVVTAKVSNQAKVLASQQINDKLISKLAKNIKSGDPENIEGQAAVYYWKYVFTNVLGQNKGDFIREREGVWPNALLNYGYAILRAITARALVGTGLLPTLGIHHHNKYNAYCLADDIMEPYRPYVDAIVLELLTDPNLGSEISKEIKAKLLGIASVDVRIENETSPLMLAVQRTATSLSKCFLGKQNKLALPVFQ
jgi:CRISP-associated protein Cas1